jgi:hypothetical protein
MQIWVFSMTTLTNCKNPISSPLQTACCGIQELAYDSVNFRKPEMILNRVTVLLFITFHKRWQLQRLN